MDMEQVPVTLDRAVDFHQKGDLERAAQGYNAVLEAVPGHYRAKTMRASLMIQSGFSADGVKELAQCIKENPDTAWRTTSRLACFSWKSTMLRYANWIGRRNSNQIIRRLWLWPLK